MMREFLEEESLKIDDRLDTLILGSVCQIYKINEEVFDILDDFFQEGDHIIHENGHFRYNRELEKAGIQACLDILNHQNIFYHSRDKIYVSEICV